MSPINSEIVPLDGGIICNALCAAGCGVAGAGGCAALCLADGPAPFADAAGVGAIAVIAAGGSAAASAVAYNI